MGQARTGSSCVYKSTLQDVRQDSGIDHRNKFSGFYVAAKRFFIRFVELSL